MRKEREKKINMVDSLDDQSGTTCHWEIKEVE